FKSGVFHPVGTDSTFRFPSYRAFISYNLTVICVIIDRFYTPGTHSVPVLPVIPPVVHCIECNAIKIIQFIIESSGETAPGPGHIILPDIMFIHIYIVIIILYPDGLYIVGTVYIFIVRTTEDHTELIVEKTIAPYKCTIV